MSKSERQGSEVRGQGSVRGGSRMIFYCLLLAAYCLLFSGCRQDMQDQPRYEAYESSGFFKDGLSSRPLVEGTVPRGYLRSDKQLFTGQNDKAQSNMNASVQRGEQAVGTNSNAQGSGSSSSSANMQGGNTSTQAASTSQTSSPLQTGAGGAQAVAGDASDTEDFPFPVTAEVMQRGQERYQIFCAMCHGATGDGDGMIVRRGFRQPPSYHEDRLRQARVGHFFRVMTEGYGAMPSYRAQVPVQDRWAIIAYVRALQLSKMNQQPTAPTAAPAANTETGGHR